MSGSPVVSQVTNTGSLRITRGEARSLKKVLIYGGERLVIEYKAGRIHLNRGVPADIVNRIRMEDISRLHDKLFSLEQLDIWLLGEENYYRLRQLNLGY